MCVEVNPNREKMYHDSSDVSLTGAIVPLKFMHELTFGRVSKIDFPRSFTLLFLESLFAPSVPSLRATLLVASLSPFPLALMAPSPFVLHLSLHPSSSHHSC